MNTTALRLISITAAVALTSLGTVSVAQAKQGSDDTTPQTTASAPATSGHGADDAVPHVAGADDAVPHVAGADDAVPHVAGADDAMPHVSGADDSVKASASSTSTGSQASNHRQKGKNKRSSGHRGAHHTANHA